MKKLFLAGALALSMAVSATSAFAAVSYGENETLSVTYNTAATQTASANSVTVNTDLSGRTGQQTILIADVASNVAAENILYINQEAAGANIFKDCGLLLPEGAETLPVGTYYVKVGGEGDAAILSGTIIVSEDQQGTTVTFKLGDVNASGAVDNNDAFAIMTKMAGGASQVGSSEYAIGETVTLIINN